MINDPFFRSKQYDQELIMHLRDRVEQLERENKLLREVAEAAKGEYCTCCATNDTRFEEIAKALKALENHHENT